MTHANVAPTVAQIAQNHVVALEATAFDLDGKLHGTQRQTIEITPSSGSRGPDLLSHLPLPPGRYMIRLAAKSEGKSGSVFVDADVPNFSKASLTMPGLLVQRSPAVRVADAVPVWQPRRAVRRDRLPQARRHGELHRGRSAVVYHRKRRDRRRL